jgi:hypothetical protein
MLRRSAEALVKPQGTMVAAKDRQQNFAGVVSFETLREWFSRLR